MKTTSIRLNSGYDMPTVGLGTWKSPFGKVQTAVEYAIDCGYRHIDCAWMYKNEKEIGDAVAKKIKEGVVKREDLFITSKLWNTFHQPEHVRKALMKSLKDLQLDYLDLYLVHFPMAFEYADDDTTFPMGDDGQTNLDDIDYIETWKEMEKLVDDKLVRSIGISNYNEFQCKRMMKNCKIPPAVNQIELHPYLVQESLVKCCKDLGISVTAYSPLGSGDRPWISKDDPVLLENPKLKEIASRLKRTPAQVAIRFQLDRGLVVIPKSVTPERIEQNFETLCFQLSNEDVKVLMGLDINFRTVPWTSRPHKYHPFQGNDSE